MRRVRHGFTLLEMILAVTITAVISVAMFTSLEIAFKTRDQAEDRLAGRQAARATLDLLAADLAAVPAPTGRIAGPFVGVDQRMGAARDGDTLRYVTAAVALPTGEEMGDLRSVELVLEEDPADPDQRVLVRYVTTNLLASTVPDATPQVLARGVIAFNIRYFDGGDWLDDWDSAQQDNALPNAVELTLTVRPERKRGDEDDAEDHDIRMVRLIQMHAAPQIESSGVDGGFGTDGLFSF